MTEKFSGFQVPSGGAPQRVHASDEKTLVVRYSSSVGYIDISEANGKQIDALDGLAVLLNVCLQFLGTAAKERSMLVGQKGRNGEKKKDDSTTS